MLMTVVSTHAVAQQRGTLTALLDGRRTSPASDTVALRVAVLMTQGWHIGAEEPGKYAVPTELTWKLPEGWRIVGSRWPTPTRRVIGRDTTFEYGGQFAIATTLVTSAPNRSGRVEALLTYGICKNVCLPGRQKLTFDVR
jgi:DsbC/DsbD-like thiol-disulfide interchange protein